MIRLPSCEPWSLILQFLLIARFHDGIISLLFAFTLGPAGFRPGRRFWLFFRPGDGLFLGRLGLGGLWLGLRLDLVGRGHVFRLRLWSGPRLRHFAWLIALGQDLGDADQREVLPVAALAARILSPAFLESNDLGPAALFDHFTGDRRTGDRRRAELDVLAADYQHFAEL